MSLTEQKRRYAQARLAGLPKKKAAIQAGCPEKTAAQAGCRLENDLDVQAAMGRIVIAEEQKKADSPAIDPSPHIPSTADDPIEFFKKFMNDLEAEPRLRLEAAKALASYTVQKPGEVGKKELKADAATIAASGRFSASKPPRLVINNVK